MALEAVGGNMYRSNAATGEPLLNIDSEGNQALSEPGFWSFNVQVVEELVKLITAQRAYELNSKAITTSDEMLQTTK